MTERLEKIGIYIRVWSIRLLPVIGFMLLFALTAVQADKFLVNKADGTDYINYTSFTVQNAREGEDVYFTVCRDHKDSYTSKGNLEVYVVDTSAKTPVKVFARDIKGHIINDCDTKVILASDYHHTPNLYSMSFCIDFRVKYGIEKTVCSISNRYRIYEQPQDINSQIQKAEAVTRTSTA